MFDDSPAVELLGFLRPFVKRRRRAEPPAVRCDVYYRPVPGSCLPERFAMRFLCCWSRVCCHARSVWDTGPRRIRKMAS